jgi:type IV secretion system protein VirB4
MQVLHLVGFGFETADTQELNYRKNVRDTVLRAIASSRLTIGAYVMRHLVRPGLHGRFTNPFARDLDESWRVRLAGGRLFVNDLFLTLTRKPVIGRTGIAGIGKNKQWDAVSRLRRPRRR